MISFAQNFEDVLLARIFRDRQTGFYVDVGAHYPFIDSVTEYFYRLGWRGINVEPLPPAFSELTRTRPFDVNLNVAIADSEGELPFFALDGFSTLNEDVAIRHSKIGLQSRKILVKTRRLDAILSEHSTAHIDFLKIDVEGAEEGVVRSNDWSRFRPSIVLIEMIDPQTQEIRFESWERVILDAGYEVVHFDGVNRWYWNNDFPSPESKCFLPPNALDRFTSFAQISAEAHAATAAREAAYEREHHAKALAKISKALTEFAQGDHSTPAPEEYLVEAWSSLKELSHSKDDPKSAIDEALKGANITIDDLKSQIENLKNASENLKRQIDNLKNASENLKCQIDSLKIVSEDLQRRLAFSEQARLILAEALSSRGIVV